jgi:hypothetical protein
VTLWKSPCMWPIVLSSQCTPEVLLDTFTCSNSSSMLPFKVAALCLLETLAENCIILCFSLEKDYTPCSCHSLGKNVPLCPSGGGLCPLACFGWCDKSFKKKFYVNSVFMPLCLVMRMCLRGLLGCPIMGSRSKLTARRRGGATAGNEAINK